ncbi:MAG: hypothetical protein FJX72_08490 [Armatimonadetes bacterium]|nr:hypothetical protein [Armatimonadota bacterium]
MLSLAEIAFPALVAAGLVGARADRAAPDLLVLMHGSGKVERYNLRTGRHRGAFIRGIPLPNCLLAGPDGRWYVSTGLPGTQGSVVMFDGRTGRRVGTFTNAPAGQPGHLARATGMAWYQGDLLVASQGDGWEPSRTLLPASPATSPVRRAWPGTKATCWWPARATGR